ncbi:MAG: cation-translocating P-type ATPase [Candidatus Coproplasma sp.]
MLEYTDKTKEEVLKLFNTSKVGLSDAEAELRLKKNGFNQLKEQKKKSLLGLFFSQFGDVMTILLIASACVSAVISFLSKDVSDLADTAIIIAIILLNAVVGAVQQYRADRAIESLKKLNQTTAKVRRGGKTKVINATDIVVGDIAVLEEGDVVPADIRVIESNFLRCSESALTGESASVEKSDCVVDKRNLNYHNAVNLLFSSSFVVGGSGEGVVIATGASTEIGAIAGMLSDVKKTQSPLERGLNKLGKIISAFVITVALALFIVDVFIVKTPLLKGFMTAVAVAVAAIPEGLPAVVSVIMAMGVQRMSRENVVIRKMKCVETLGGCTCICTDKTGTLTGNCMKVVKTVCACKTSSPQDTMGVTEQIAVCMDVCNTVKESGNDLLGDPTEVALKRFAKDSGVKINYKVTGQLPFSSDRKLMSVRAKVGGAERIYTKGAPEVIINCCTHIFDCGKLRSINDSDRLRFNTECAEMSKQALRVLAFAYKDGGELTEDNLILLGACGILDDLKEGVKEAVESCEKAGISTVMITGDSRETAFAIAKRAGICRDESCVYTGEQLDKLTKPQLIKAVKEGRVFARVTPKHKNIIVKLKKAEGNVVAVTGDGVNDAPCVKSADIGVVMGRSGTEVTKSVADMVIADDNFKTIVAGVREGRRISSNIKKTIQFFLSTNLAEVLSIVAVTFMFLGCSFLPSTQLLWLNLVTDSFPVLALGVEKGNGDDMLRPPERVEKALFSKSSLTYILISSLYITGVTVASYAFTLFKFGADTAVTVAFLTLTFCELFHVFNVRSGRKSAFVGFFSNKILLLTVLLGVGVNVALCLTPLSSAFSIEPLPFKLWALAVCSSLSIIPFCEAYKLLLFIIKRVKGSRLEGKTKRVKPVGLSKQNV